MLLDRYHPHSSSVQCEHPAALRSSAAGSFQAVTHLPPQAPSEESRPSTPRYGFAVVKPGRYSSRPCVIFALRAVLACVPHRCGPSSAKTPQSLPGSQDTAVRIRSRPLAQTVSVITALFSGIRLRPELALPATDCAVPPASTSWRPTPIRRAVPVRVHPDTPLDRQCVAHSFGPSRPRPRRPSSHPSRRSLPLLQGARGLPSAALQSPPPPHTRPPPRPRSTSFRVLWHCQTLSRHPHNPRTTAQQLRDWTAP